MEETKDSAPTSPSYSLEAPSSGDSLHLPDLQVKLETNETSSLPSPSSMGDSDDEARKEDNEEEEEDRKPIVVSSSPSSTASHGFLADSPPRSSLLIPTLLSSTPISLDANDDVQVVKEVITIDSGSEDDEDFDDDDEDDDSSSMSSLPSSHSSHGYSRRHRFSTDEGEETDNSDHESGGWRASSNAEDDEDDDDDSSSSSPSSSPASSSSSATPSIRPLPFYDFPGFPSVHNLHQMQSEWIMNAHDQMRRASSAAGVIPATYSFTSSAFPHTTLHPSSSTSMSSHPHHSTSPSSSSSSSVPVPVSVSSPPSPVSTSPPPLPSAASPSFFHFPTRDISMSDRRDHWTSDSRPPPSSSSSSSSSPSTSSSRIPPMIPTVTPMGVPMPFPFPSRPATMTTTTTTTRRMSPMDFPHFMPSFGPPTPMVPHPFIDLSSDQPPEFVQLTSTSISSFSPFNHPSFPFVHLPPGPPHLFLHPHSHPHVHTHSRDHSHRRHHHHHRPHTTVHARPLPHALHQLQFRDISSEDYEMLRMMEASSGSSSAGASQRKIQSLPVSKVTEEESGKHACCVCLDDMLKDDMVKRLPCGHYFHQKCIDEWLQTKQECPLDKKNPFAPVRK